MSTENKGTLGNAVKPMVATDQHSLVVPDGTYTIAQLVAEAVTDGYAGGKTKVSKIQFVAYPGSFTVGDIVRTVGSGGTHERGGNQISGIELEEIDEFTVVVADGGVEVSLVLF